KIAEILGVELSEDKEQRSAFNACGGGSQAIDKFIYYGIYDCLAAAMVLGGQKSCSWACLGFCSCQEVCPVCAIDIIDRVAVINPDICIGCGKCMEICPKKTIDMVPKGKAYIRCCSQDKGAEVNKVCRVGCIACQKCVKVCPVKCISMENNLARIDHKKCIACGKCVEVCPKKCIEGNFKRETIDHRLKQ
ncbi:MAG: 4Fe-4S dicluster domain-containing protein, partial [Candidatus Omnitrophota bacterium]